MAGFDLTPSEESAHVRDRAHAWLARFAPLVMGDEILDDRALRSRLALVDDLAVESSTIQHELETLEEIEDIELRQTFRRAATQLDSVESDLRRTLAKVAPGDPEGLVDLEMLQERLEERAARQEVGLPTTHSMPSVLELKTSPGNLGAAAFLGMFGIGWSAFTALHATLMIGGMAKAFGAIALVLLGFYAIFFTVGFGMLWTSFLTASTEEIKLDGRELTVVRRLGPFTKSKRHKLSAKTRAKVGEGTVSWGPSSSGQNRRAKPSPAVLLTDADGRPITLGMNATVEGREETIRQINAYLDVTA